MDLLVIARGLPERRYDRALFLEQIVAGLPDAPDFSLLGKAPEEFESHFPSLYLDLGLDGVLLFDRAGYTAAKLSRIREIIQQAGLFRERDNGDMFWNWKNPPGPHWEVTWEGFRELA